MSTTVIDAPTADEVAEPLDDTLPTDEVEEDDAGVFDRHYEIIDGVKVELPPMSTKSSGVAGELARVLGNWGIDAGVGQAYPETLFKLPRLGDRGRSRKPDVAFVPYSTWAKGRELPDANAWNVVPDLCVEVISPTDVAENVRAKTDEYFRAGVKLVWVVYPKLRVVDVYDSPDQCRTLRRADALDGGAVLPGFRVGLAALFPAPETEVTA